MIFMNSFQLLSETESELVHGGWGSLLDISVLNGAEFGQGSNFFVGYLGGGAVSQATNGGTAISAGDDITYTPAQAEAPVFTPPGHSNATSRRARSFRRGR